MTKAQSSFIYVEILETICRGYKKLIRPAVELVERRQWRQERLAGEMLSLPCFPGMTDEEIDHVCEALLEATC